MISVWITECCIVRTVVPTVSQTFLRRHERTTSKEEAAGFIWVTKSVNSKSGTGVNGVGEAESLGGFKTALIVLKMALGLWEYLENDSEKYLALAALTECWYFVRQSFNTSYKTWSWSFSH